MLLTPRTDHLRSSAVEVSPRLAPNRMDSRPFAAWAVQSEWRLKPKHQAPNQDPVATSQAAHKKAWEAEMKNTVVFKHPDYVAMTGCKKDVSVHTIFVRLEPKQTSDTSTLLHTPLKVALLPEKVPPRWTQSLALLVQNATSRPSAHPVSTHAEPGSFLSVQSPAHVVRGLTHNPLLVA